MESEICGYFLLLFFSRLSGAWGFFVTCVGNSYLCLNKFFRIVKKLSLILFTLVSVLLLTLAVPREGKFVFEYKEGTPWKYAPLIADFEFSIIKSEKAIKMEKDSVLQNFQPFFNKSITIGQQQVKAFIADYKARRIPVPEKYANYVIKQLGLVYNTGVMSPSQMSDLVSHRYQNVHIVEGQDAVTQSTSAIYTTRTAYETIMGADSAGYLHDVLALCNINNYLTPNLTFDKAKTDAAREDALNSVITSSGMIVAGQRVIDMGEIVTPQLKLVLDSYMQESARLNTTDNNLWKQMPGQALLIFIILSIFPLYLLTFQPKYTENVRTLALFYVLITIFPILSYIMVREHWFSVYLVPYAMVPLFVRVFFDSRTATMAMITSLLLTSIGLTGPFEFFMIESIVGFVTVYALREMTERAQILRIALFVVVVGLLTQFAYDMAASTNISDLDHSRYVYLAVSGVALLFAYPVMYLIERIFGYTSSVTLIELSNINHPLLRRMSKEAQGTFNHSMQVGNLAAEVANKIGASAQLVRTGALFHDIGKMLNPAFFTENQSGVNPHDSLTDRDDMSKEEQSAQIIISHVTQGLQLAEKNNLPQSIRDFISTHHGRSKTGYFYIQWQNNHPGETPRDELFTYPGPNPFTREQAILMMCDAVEASSRSLKEYTEEAISGLVNKIIDGQVQAGYFQECPITFRDIQDAKRVLIDSLKTVYHTRIAYPELNKDKQKAQSSIWPHLLGGNRYYHHNKN